MNVIFTSTRQKALLKQAYALYSSEFLGPTGISVRRVQHLVQTRRYRVFVARLASRVVAVAFVWTDSSHQFAHIDYIVVDVSLRHRGIGTALMNFISQKTANALLTVEVIKKDIPFYTRLRFVILPLAYSFPPSSRRIPLTLMLRSKGGTKFLSRASMEHIVTALFCDLHRQKPTRTILKKCLASIPLLTVLVQSQKHS